MRKSGKNKEQMEQMENKWQSDTFKLGHINNPIKYKKSKYSIYKLENFQLDKKARPDYLLPTRNLLYL